MASSKHHKPPLLPPEYLVALREALEAGVSAGVLLEIIYQVITLTEGEVTGKSLPLRTREVIEAMDSDLKRGGS